MTYEKQNFKDGDILCCYHLNNIEAGIDAVAKKIPDDIATKTYVDEAIANIEIPEGGESADLSNYYTKSEVDAAITQNTVSVATYTVKVPAKSWSSVNDSDSDMFMWYEQEISVSGIRATDDPIVDIVVSLDSSGGQEDVVAQLDSWLKVTRIDTSTNKIVLRAYFECPTTDFTIKLKVVR